MISTKDVAIIYDTLLSSPGMAEPVKIDLRLPRKNVLMLTRIIDLGLTAKDNGAQAELMQNVTPETFEELKDISRELLKKAGLTEMNEKLILLSLK